MNPGLQMFGETNATPFTVQNKCFLLVENAIHYFN
jgi:hypothetical protein